MNENTFTPEQFLSHINHNEKFQCSKYQLTFTQIPQPIQSSSLMYAILSVGVTSMHSLPIRTTGHDFLHSCRHLLGLHLSGFIIAILVNLSAMAAEICLRQLAFCREIGKVAGLATIL